MRRIEAKAGAFFYDLKDVTNRGPGILGMHAGMDQDGPVFFLGEVQQAFPLPQQVGNRRLDDGGLDLEARAGEFLVQFAQGRQPILLRDTTSSTVRGATPRGPGWRNCSIRPPMDP